MRDAWCAILRTDSACAIKSAERNSEARAKKHQDIFLFIRYIFETAITRSHWRELLLLYILAAFASTDSMGDAPRRKGNLKVDPEVLEQQVSERKMEILEWVIGGSFLRIDAHWHFLHGSTKTVAPIIDWVIYLLFYRNIGEMMLLFISNFKNGGKSLLRIRMYMVPTSPRYYSTTMSQ